MDRFITRLLFAGTTIAGLAHAPVRGEDSVKSTPKECASADEPKTSADQEAAVEKKTAESNEVAAVAKPRRLFQHATYPAAWKAAQQSNRPILVFVSMPNCHYCVKMKEQVYCLPRVKDLVSNSFETLKADRFAHPKLISSLKIRLYPTTVLVSPNNKIVDVIEGYSDPAKFQQRLQTGLASLSTPSVEKVAAR